MRTPAWQGTLAPGLLVWRAGFVTPVTTRSPAVGLAAWLLDHDTGTYEHLAQLFAGQPYGAITRDEWLDNTSLYWFTNTATSAARLY
jgi:hypothetical protein